MADTVTPMPRSVRKLASKFCEVEQFRFTTWSLVLAEGVTLDDMLQEVGWAHILTKHKISAGDVVRVRDEENTLYAELFVRGKTETSIKLGLIRKVEFNVPSVSADLPFDVRWNVGKRAYDVARKADRQVVAGGFKVKEEANAWITEHMKLMAA